MSHHVRSTFIAAAAALVLAATPAAQHKPTTHRHPEAAKLKNPVAADAQSIASGQKLYARHCAECHGDKGRGDGAAGEYLGTTPPNLVDAKWEHGSTDGEIFVVIRDGTGDDMPGFRKKLPQDKQIWDVVNFVRSLGPSTTKSH